MTKKRKILLAALAVIVLVLNVLVLSWHSSPVRRINVRITLSGDQAGTIEFYHAAFKDGWLPERQTDASYSEEDAREQKEKTLTFDMTTDATFARLDLGEQDGAVWNVSRIEITGFGASDEIALETLPGICTALNQVTALYSGGVLAITAEGTDPFIVFPVSYPVVSAAAARNTLIRDWIVKIIALVILDGLMIALIVKRDKLLSLPVEVWQNRALIYKLAKNDFKTRYAGSYLGIFWAFVQPVVTVLVYWVVFGIGLKSGSMSNVPFVVYLTAGIVPWFYLQEVLTSGTNAMLEYSYLVKKVVFKISILPMVKAISALFVHVFFVAVAMVIAALYGIFPSVYTLQIFYYFIALFIFSLAIIYGTSAIVIFFRDLSQIISIILQVGIWTVPIMWNISIVNEKYRWIFHINPMYYIVDGYRNSIYNHVWFWSDLRDTVYFWGVTLVLFALGSWIFKRLKPHFADVL